MASHNCLCASYKRRVLLTEKTGAIDDVHRAVAEAKDEKHTEGKRIIEELAKLKYELQHDRVLT